LAEKNTELCGRSGALNCQTRSLNTIINTNRLIIKSIQATW
jgi:hypothetical protein